MIVKEGEVWLVRIDDAVDLTKIMIIKKYVKAYEFAEMLPGDVVGPHRHLSRRDVEFVEKIQ
jgi:hypothetical protein